MQTVLGKSALTAAATVLEERGPQNRGPLTLHHQGLAVDVAVGAVGPIVETVPNVYPTPEVPSSVAVAEPEGNDEAVVVVIVVQLWSPVSASV